ncbi:MAG: helix-turn-helix transcriptional regulator [Deltaproteobacteria bacterium]|nr:helix-turn-helix transcriptional regulator [Deltaproteobacteria bacterium]
MVLPHLIPLGFYPLLVPWLEGEGSAAPDEQGPAFEKEAGSWVALARGFVAEGKFNQAKKFLDRAEAIALGVPQGDGLVLFGAMPAAGVVEEIDQLREGIAEVEQHSLARIKNAVTELEQAAPTVAPEKLAETLEWLSRGKKLPRYVEILEKLTLECEAMSQEASGVGDLIGARELAAEIQGRWVSAWDGRDEHGWEQAEGYLQIFNEYVELKKRKSQMALQLGVLWPEISSLRFEVEIKTKPVLALEPNLATYQELPVIQVFARLQATEPVAADRVQEVMADLREPSEYLAIDMEHLSRAVGRLKGLYEQPALEMFLERVAELERQKQAGSAAFQEAKLWQELLAEWPVLAQAANQADITKFDGEKIEQWKMALGIRLAKYQVFLEAERGRIHQQEEPKRPLRKVPGFPVPAEEPDEDWVSSREQAVVVQVERVKGQILQLGKVRTAEDLKKFFPEFFESFEGQVRDLAWKKLDETNLIEPEIKLQLTGYIYQSGTVEEKIRAYEGIREQIDFLTTQQHLETELVRLRQMETEVARAESNLEAIGFPSSGQLYWVQQQRRHYEKTLAKLKANHVSQANRDLAILQQASVNDQLETAYRFSRGFNLTTDIGVIALSGLVGGVVGALVRIPAIVVMGKRFGNITHKIASAMVFFMTEQRLHGHEVWVEQQSFDQNMGRILEGTATNYWLLAVTGKFLQVSQRITRALIRERALLNLRGTGEISEYLLGHEMARIEENLLVYAGRGVAHFGFEVGGLGVASVGTGIYEHAKLGEFSPFQTMDETLFSQAAWEQHVVFVLGLRVAHVVGKPIMAPVHEFTREVVDHQVRERLAVLERAAKDYEALLDENNVDALVKLGALRKLLEAQGVVLDISENISTAKQDNLDALARVARFEKDILAQRQWGKMIEEGTYQPSERKRLIRAILQDPNVTNKAEILKCANHANGLIVVAYRASQFQLDHEAATCQKPSDAIFWLQPKARRPGTKLLRKAKVFAQAAGKTLDERMQKVTQRTNSIEAVVGELLIGLVVAIRTGARAASQYEKLRVYMETEVRKQDPTANVAVQLEGEDIQVTVNSQLPMPEVDHRALGELGPIDIIWKQNNDTSGRVRIPEEADFEEPDPTLDPISRWDVVLPEIIDRSTLVATLDSLTGNSSVDLDITNDISFAHWVRARMIEVSRNYCDVNRDDLNTHNALLLLFLFEDEGVNPTEITRNLEDGQLYRLLIAFRHVEDVVKEGRLGFDERVLHNRYAEALKEAARTVDPLTRTYVRDPYFYLYVEQGKIPAEEINQFLIDYADTLQGTGGLDVLILVRAYVELRQVWDEAQTRDFFTALPPSISNRVSYLILATVARYSGLSKNQLLDLVWRGGGQFLPLLERLASISAQLNNPDSEPLPALGDFEFAVRRVNRNIQVPHRILLDALGEDPNLAYTVVLACLGYVIPGEPTLAHERLAEMAKIIQEGLRAEGVEDAVYYAEGTLLAARIAAAYGEFGLAYAWIEDAQGYLLQSDESGRLAIGGWEELRRTEWEVASHYGDLTPLQINLPYDTQLPPWQNAIRGVLAGGILADTYQVVRLPLQRVVPIHTLYHPTAASNVFDTIQIIRQIMLFKLTMEGWQQGQEVSDSLLYKTLSSSDSHGLPPLVSAETEGGHALLLNGHHRMAALISLVADGLLPPGTLERVPFVRVHDQSPTHILQTAFVGGEAGSIGPFSWREVMGFSDRTRSLMGALGATKEIGDLLPQMPVRVGGERTAIPISDSHQITWLDGFTTLLGEPRFQTRVAELARKPGLDVITIDDVQTLAGEFGQPVDAVIVAANRVRFPDLNFSQYTARDGHPMLIAHEREAANLRRLCEVDPERNSVAWYLLENRTHPDNFFSRERLAAAAGISDLTLQRLENAEVLAKGETNYPIRETFDRLESVLRGTKDELAHAFNQTVYPALALDRLAVDFRPFIDHNTNDKDKIDGYLYLLDQREAGRDVGTCQIAFFVYRHQLENYPSHGVLSSRLNRGDNFWNKLETDELKPEDVPWGEVKAELEKAGLLTEPLLQLLEAQGFTVNLQNPLHTPPEVRRLAAIAATGAALDRSSPRAILAGALGADGVAVAADRIGINRGTLAPWLNRDDAPLASPAVLAKIKAAYPQFEADRFYLAQRQRAARPGQRTVVDFFPELAGDTPHLILTTVEIEQAHALTLPPLVAAARRARGMTLEQFGALIGVSRPVVNRLETVNKQIQDLDVLWNLAQELSVDPRVLFIHNEPGVLQIFQIREPDRGGVRETGRENRRILVRALDALYRDPKASPKAIKRWEDWAKDRGIIGAILKRMFYAEDPAHLDPTQFYYYARWINLGLSSSNLRDQRWAIIGFQTIRMGLLKNNQNDIYESQFLPLVRGEHFAFVELVQKWEELGLFYVDRAGNKESLRKVLQDRDQNPAQEPPSSITIASRRDDSFAFSKFSIAQLVPVGKNRHPYYEIANDSSEIESILEKELSHLPPGKKIPVTIIAHSNNQGMGLVGGRFTGPKMLVDKIKKYEDHISYLIIKGCSTDKPLTAEQREMVASNPEGYTLLRQLSLGLPNVVVVGLQEEGLLYSHFRPNGEPVFKSGTAPWIRLKNGESLEDPNPPKF